MKSAILYQLASDIRGPAVQELRKVASADYQLAPNERPSLIVIMPLSSPENWKDKDCVNDDIWSQSPEIQQKLAVQFPVGAVGSVGGQQAMFPPDGLDTRGTATDPLPWVPDLVGKDSDGPDAVMIIGSAYAPFVSGYARRGRRIALARYRGASSWCEFQNIFLAGVVQDDADYYNRISGLLVRGNMALFQKTIITDWCRASYVKLGPRPRQPGGTRPDKGGDEICSDEGAGVFSHYVERNLDWHMERLKDFRGKVVLLGLLSRGCMEFACQRSGWEVRYEDFNTGGAAVRPLTINGRGGFWTPADGQPVPRPPGTQSVVGRIVRGPSDGLTFTVIQHPSIMTDVTSLAWSSLVSDWLAN